MMDNVNNPNMIVINDVLSKLQKLNCTLLGNGDIAWVKELLFKPGCHRYQLLEWIFSKFDYPQNVSGPQNPDEEKIIRDLQTVIEDLGFYRKYSQDIVKGTAPIDKQLEFWSTLVDMLCVRCDIDKNVSETEDSICSSEKSRYIIEECEYVNSCMERVIKSVNLRNLFKCELQLLPPYLEKEINLLHPSKLQEYQIPILKDIKSDTKKHSIDVKDLYNKALENKMSLFSKREDDNEKNLFCLENSVLEASLLVQDCAKGEFCDVYNELETLALHVTPEKFVDLGPDFQNVVKNLETVLELKTSLPKIALANSKYFEITECVKDMSNVQGLVESKSSDEIARLLANH